jgi:ADP-ribosyl-[dinitrogen reductase] hydrolase
MPDLRERCLGALVGLACGDAVGTTVEFKQRGSFPPVTDLVGGGPFGLAAGQWTDDTSMALCMAESLVECGRFDAADQMSRYVRWWKKGHLSATGRCFDIGGATRAALQRFADTGEPYAGSNDPRSAGNGSLMRLAPVVLFFHPDSAQVLHYAGESSRTTHAAPEAVECCRLFAAMLDAALAGAERDKILTGHGCTPTEAKVTEIADASYAGKSDKQIEGSGYCVESLEAALWCFRTTETFRDAVLTAANLGDDADTTAAIVGQIAGAHYGIDAIPSQWRAKLALSHRIEELAVALAAQRDAG